jgi:pyruvate/2-oxoacid:ferredoxin oxidoreductase beta subunit
MTFQAIWSSATGTNRVGELEIAWLHEYRPLAQINGGDGCAYDIGFGGLDHVLASARNINSVPSPGSR